MAGARQAVPDQLQCFLAQVRTIPLLTAAQEVRLAQAIERGDADARRRLIVANLRLVVSIAKRYRGRGLPFADLIQEGCVGLIEAVDRFDHRRGFRFSTYGAWRIENAVKNAVRSRGRQVRLPDDVLTTLRAVKAAEHGLLQQQGREPTIAEISRASGLLPRDVERVLALAGQPISLDALHVDHVRGGGGEDASTQEFELVLIRQLVAQTLGELDRRERYVMERRFGLGSTPQTLQQIGDMLGLTHERVRQIQNASLERIREVIDAA